MPARKEEHARRGKQSYKNCKRNPSLPRTGQSPTPTVFLSREPNMPSIRIHNRSPVAELYIRDKAIPKENLLLLQ
jgi:hypothetical protein